MSDSRTISEGDASHDASHWVWSRALIPVPFVSGLLVLALVMSLGGTIGFLRKIEEAPRYELAKLFPELGAPAESTARAPITVAGSGSGLESRFADISRELRASIGWALAALALAIALLVSLTVPWVVAFQALDPVSDRIRLSILGIGLIVLTVMALAAYSQERQILPHVHQVLVDHLSAGVKQYRELTKALALAAVTLIFASISATLYMPRPPTLIALRAQAERLQTLLYISAGILVAGVLEIAFLLRWPAARLDPIDAEPIIVLGNVVSTGAGTLLTLLLLATYGTAALIMRRRIADISREVVASERAQWLARHGFKSTPTGQLLRVIAMIAPLIAGGPVVQLLERFAG